ncbi:DUF6545 domain-containing protein [Nocardia sp. CA-119907]|uniref:DUF6545 domain-containing protein n=1 Tax=Nocardia sp. CA-119907 TaxID=3239973 RepID=UPI003D9A0128
MVGVGFEPSAAERNKMGLPFGPMTVPWTLGEFCHWFGAETGLWIDVAPWRVADASPPKCATLLILDNRVIVRYDPRRSVRHRVQQIMHEFGHVLCDHVGDNRFAIGPGLFTTGLDPEKIAAVVQRHDLDGEHEIQAEILGTQLALMCTEVTQLGISEGRLLPARVMDAGRMRRVRALTPLWTALTDAAPEVRLCDLEALSTPAFAEHRMQVEIEDAIVALAPYLRPPADGRAESWVWSISDATARRSVGNVITTVVSAPAWPTDEGRVLAIAKAWTQFQGTSHSSMLR